MNTNRNEVRKLIQEHIKEYYSMEDLKGDIESLKNIYSNDYQAAMRMVEGGCFLCYHSDVKEFLNSLGINPTNKKYLDTKSWELYKHLIAINCERLLNGKEVKK